MEREYGLRRIFIASMMVLLLCSSVLTVRGFLVDETGSAINTGSGGERKDADSTRKEYNPDEIKEAIEKGLLYLNDTKQADGGWNVGGGYGKAVNVVGSILRSFIDYNATDPRWQDAIEGAVRFLKYSWHDPEDYPQGRERDYNGGLLFNDNFAPTERSRDMMYSHGSGATALIDYYFHTRDISILPYINASVELIYRVQNTEHKPSSLGGPINRGSNHYGGWRYRPTSTSSDTSLTGWNMHAMILAESTGLHDVPDWAFEAAEIYLREKRYSAGRKGFGYHRASYTGADLTGIGVFCLNLLGKGNTPEAQGGVEFIMNRPPQWGLEPSPDGAGGNRPFYWYYHSTIAMYLVGGEKWNEWKRLMTNMLIDHQNEDGSWSPTRSESSLGNNYATAMALMSLELGISRPNEVSLEPQEDPDTGEEDPMVKLVEPEGTVTYNISVASSLGFVETPLNKPYQEEDRINLTLSDPLPGWSAELKTATSGDGQVRPDGSRLWWVELAWRETTNVTLEVTAPPLGKMSEPCVVNLIATLKNEYGVTQAKLATISILDINVDFELEFLAEKDEFTGKKMGSIAPGERKVYQAYLKNKGNVNDTYDIKMISPSNWKVMFDNALDFMNISLSRALYGSDSVIINITIEAPITASKGERVDVTLMAVSTMFSQLGMGTLKRTDQLSLTVTGLPALVLYSEEDNKHVDPGGTAEYEVAIVNNFESTLEVTFSFSGTGKVIDSVQVFSHNWSAAFPTKNVAIKSRERLKVKFQIGAPVYAIAGTRKVLQVEATGYDNFGMEYEASPISVTAITNLIASISASATPSSQRCEPGESVNYTVTVTNEGNGDDIADLKIADLPLNWDHEFSSTSKYLEPYQEVNVDLMISVPWEALADSDPGTEELDPYHIGINITGREKLLDYGETLYVDLGVEELPDISISADKTSNFAPPRSRTDFKFRLENQGNAVDVVRINLTETLGDDWDIFFPYLSLNHKMASLSTLKDFNFTDIIDAPNMARDVLYIPRAGEFTTLDIRLDVGQRIYVAVHARVPNMKEGDSFTFKVKALSEGDTDPGDNAQEFEIDIIMPDLYVKDDISHTKLKVGKIASFTARIGNNGNLSANDVRVALYVDKKEVDSRNLPRVVIGDEKIVTFVWPVTKGRHTVKVAVDPDNELAEENENNNLASDKINAEEDKILFGVGNVVGSTTWLVFLLIMIGLAGAGIVYAVHHFKHRY